jgi:hypothetical protein
MRKLETRVNAGCNLSGHVYTVLYANVAKTNRIYASLHATVQTAAHAQVRKLRFF